MKVTIAEIVEALNAYGAELVKVGFVETASPTLPERIRIHGIQLDYVPMTDDELLAEYKTARSHIECLRGVEQTVLARIGVAPTLDQAKAKHQLCGCVLCTCEDEVQCHGCGAKYCQDHKIKRDGSYLTDVEQAKAICEQAGFAVVPKEPTDAMLKAGCARHLPQSIGEERMALLYRAMLEAAKDKP